MRIKIVPLAGTVIFSEADLIHSRSFISVPLESSAKFYLLCLGKRVHQLAM